MQNARDLLSQLGVVRLTRDGDVGPYDTKKATETAAEQLGQALDALDDPVLAVALIGEFVRRRNAALD